MALLCSEGVKALMQGLGLRVWLKDGAGGGSAGLGALHHGLPRHALHRHQAEGHRPESLAASRHLRLYHCGYVTFAESLRHAIPLCEFVLCASYFVWGGVGVGVGEVVCIRVRARRPDTHPRCAP